jgi:PKD repeat protein
MAESTEKPEGKKGSWFKAMIGTVAGLMSGAFMMYLSPLLDKVVRPAKPVANFAVDVQGLTVQFHNRSSSRAEGWWDFGDGSPLEPVNAETSTVLHTYAKPGTYTVKLSLRNLLNEENDRSVTINVDSANTDPPAILALEAIPVSGSFYAPATFRLVSKMKNTSLCVWETDPDRPLDIIPDPPAEQDRLVTYNEPGGYVVKLVAVNGKQAKEKSIIVQVMEPPTGAVTAVLHVTEQMVKVDKADRRVTLTESFGGNASATSMPINRKIDARLGW